MTHTHKTTSLALALAVALAAATPTMAQTVGAPPTAPGQPAFGPFGQPVPSGYGPGQPSIYMKDGIECMTDINGRGQFVPCSASGNS